MILKLTWLILEQKFSSTQCIQSYSYMAASKQKVISKWFSKRMLSYYPLCAVWISKEHKTNKTVVIESGLVLFQLGLCHYYYLLTFVV